MPLMYLSAPPQVETGKAFAVRCCSCTFFGHKSIRPHVHHDLLCKIATSLSHRENSIPKADMKFITVLMSTFGISLFLLQGVVHGNDEGFNFEGKNVFEIMYKNAMMQKNIIFPITSGRL